MNTVQRITRSTANQPTEKRQNSRPTSGPAIRKIVRDLIGTNTCVPVDLHAVAERLGVSDVICEPLPFDGLVLKENNNFIIKLNSGSPNLRRRFTLAHELGHVLLNHHTAASGDRTEISCHSDEDEKLCNAAASEFLMPEELTRQFFSKRAVSPASLCEFGSQFQVSLQAAAVRVRQIKITKVTFVLLKRRTPPYYSQIWRVGSLRIDPVVFLPSAEGCFGESNCASCRTSIETPTGQIIVAMDAMRLGRSDSTLAALSR